MYTYERFSIRGGFAARVKVHTRAQSFCSAIMQVYLLRRRSCWKLVVGLSLACSLGIVVFTNVLHGHRNLRLVITAAEGSRGLSRDAAWSSMQARSAENIVSSVWRRDEAVSTQKDITPTTWRRNEGVSTQKDTTPTTWRRNEAGSTQKDITPTTWRRNEGVSTQKDITPTTWRRNEAVSTQKDITPTTWRRNEGVSTQKDITPTTWRRNEGVSTQKDITPTTWRRNEAVSTQKQIALMGWRRDEIVSTMRNATPIENTPMQRSTKLKDPHSQRQVTGDVNDEVTAVLHNLVRCLSAANLTSYFIQNDLLSRAKSNAQQFIASLRKSIPTEFTSTYSSPCWDIRLDMKTCGSENDLPCSFPWFGVEGHFGTQSYKLLLFSVDLHLFSALKNHYPVGFSSSLVCLPKVFLAGFPKCGSSYVYCLLQKLAGHRQSLIKEPHFWVPRGPFETHRFPHDDKDLTMYLVNFQPSVEVEKESSFSLPIDGSPNLLFQWPQYGLHEGIVNYCLVPAVLPQVLPESKFIVVMRNPVDMLYSAFWFSCSDRAVDLSRNDQLQMPHRFHKRALTKINMFKNCTHSAPVDKCMDNIFTKLNNSKKDCGRIRLEVGFYYLHIRKWLAVVPRKQFLFLTTEELKSPRNVEMKIFDFLDVGLHLHPQQGNAQDQNFCKNIQKTYDYHHDPELKMKDVTRKILTMFFKPYNRKLAALLHDDKYLWAHET